MKSQTHANISIEVFMNGQKRQDIVDKTKQYDLGQWTNPKWHHKGKYEDQIGNVTIKNRNKEQKVKLMKRSKEKIAVEY